MYLVLGFFPHALRCRTDWGDTHKYITERSVRHPISSCSPAARLFENVRVTKAGRERVIKGKVDAQLALV